MQLHKDVKVGEIIRKKETREAWIVVGKNSQGLLVCNLHDNTDPANVFMILPRADGLWEMDREMVDMSEQEAQVIEKALPIIESLEETLQDEVE